MIDQAGIMMAQGAEIACERIAGVNDNMTQPHYHNYYELYYLEKERGISVFRMSSMCLSRGS